MSVLDLHRPDELLVLAPEPGRIVGPGVTFARIQTLGTVLDQAGGLQRDVAQLAEFVRQECDLQPTAVQGG